MKINYIISLKIEADFHVLATFGNVKSVFDFSKKNFSLGISYSTFKRKIDKETIQFTDDKRTIKIEKFNRISSFLTFESELQTKLNEIENR